MERLLYNKKEVCRLLGISYEKLRIWILYEGFPKPLKFKDSNQVYKFSKKSIEQWIAKKEQESL